MKILLFVALLLVAAFVVDAYRFGGRYAHASVKITSQIAHHFRR